MASTTFLRSSSSRSVSARRLMSSFSRASLARPLRLRQSLLPLHLLVKLCLQARTPEQHHVAVSLNLSINSPLKQGLFCLTRVKLEIYDCAYALLRAKHAWVYRCEPRKGARQICKLAGGSAYSVLLCGAPLCFYLRLDLKLLRFLIGSALLLQPAGMQLHHVSPTESLKGLEG